MTIADYLRGYLGQGVKTESAMVGKLVERDYAYPEAVRLVKEAITELAIAGRIEHIPGTTAYRIPLGTPMEDEKARGPVSPWKQHKGPK